MRRHLEEGSLLIKTLKNDFFNFMFRYISCSSPSIKSDPHWWWLTTVERHVAIKITHMTPQQMSLRDDSFVQQLMTRITSKYINGVQSSDADMSSKFHRLIFMSSAPSQNMDGLLHAYFMTKMWAVPKNNFELTFSEPDIFSRRIRHRDTRVRDWSQQTVKHPVEPEAHRGEWCALLPKHSSNSRFVIFKNLPALS